MQNIFDLILFGVWPWYISGPVIGSISFLTLFLINMPLGLSGSLDSFCNYALPASSTQDRFLSSKRIGKNTISWKFYFGIGVFGGALLAQLSKVNITEHLMSNAATGYLYNIISPTFEFESLSGLFNLPGYAMILYMFIGGILIGFGTRLSNGCTSGHGILGMSQMAKSSIIATVVFFATGIIITQAMILIGGS